MQDYFWYIELLLDSCVRYKRDVYDRIYMIQKAYFITGIIKRKEKGPINVKNEW